MEVTAKLKSSERLYPAQREDKSSFPDDESPQRNHSSRLRDFTTRVVSSDKPSRAVATAEAVLVVLIWASSFVLVKMVLDYVGPLTLGGLRYFLAFLMMIPLMVRNRDPDLPRSRSLWVWFVLLGIAGYTIGNGAVFWALEYMPATTGSFIMNCSPLVVVFASTLWLREAPTWRQTLGMVIALVGSFLFFYNNLGKGELVGLGLATAGMIGFAVFQIMGRAVARTQEVDTLSMTALPLAFGGGILLFLALPLEGIPALPLIGWGIVLILAVVNTAIGYLLYNDALQALSAIEMDIMRSVVPLGTAAFAWLLLGEEMTMLQLSGMIIVIIGVVLVQLRRKNSAAFWRAKKEP